MKRVSLWTEAYLEILDISEIFKEIWVDVLNICLIKLDSSDIENVAFEIFVSLEFLCRSSKEEEKILGLFASSGSLRSEIERWDFVRDCGESWGLGSPFYDVRFSLLEVFDAKKFLRMWISDLQRNST